MAVEIRLEHRSLREGAVVITRPSSLAKESMATLLKIHNEYAEVPVKVFRDKNIACLMTFNAIQSVDCVNPIQVDVPDDPEQEESTMAIKKKATAKKTATASPGKRGRKAEYIDKKILKVVDNPKRPGSASFKRFAFYKKGDTVAQFLAKGGTLGDIRYDLDREFIALSVK